MANSSKYNAEQCANMNLNSAGIIFIYAGKDGKDTAMHFFGKEYEMIAKTQDELLRVMRNLKTTLWMVKEKETELREKNDGIRCKYRSSTPAYIFVNDENNQRVKKYVTDCSDFSKFGFFPTKKDLERSARDKKKYIHSSTIAMLEALNFRVEFPKIETAPVETAAENTAPVAEPVVESVAEVAAETTAPVIEPVAEVTAEVAAPVAEVAIETAAPVEAVAEVTAEVSAETAAPTATTPPATSRSNKGGSKRKAADKPAATSRSNKGRSKRRTADKPTETVAEVTETANEPIATTETTAETTVEAPVEMAAA